MKQVLLPIITLLALSAQGQLVIDNATFFIGENAVVTVQGDLTTNVAIQAGGAAATQGKIQMKGTTLQTITANGNVIPRLEIDNTSHVQLSSDLRVNNRIDFVNGRLRTSNHNLVVPADAVFVGNTAARFIETNGTGEVRQLVPVAVANKVVPIGTGANYTPAQITVAGATLNATSYVGVRATGSAIPTPERHPRTESYLTTAWNVSKSGVTGGTVTVQGTYVNGQITGTEADLRGMFWNGTAWSLAGGAQNAANNTVAANVPGAGGIIYGMNRFLLASPKVFLQGAYNTGTGLMNDGLRSGTNVIPTADPYRTAPYNTQFAHINNATGETVAASLFNNNANPENNIVDWVFVELRSITNATTAPVVQTRSVLVQRDGDLVDIDGVSPVYFKNVDAGNFAISIRHRNHIGLSTNPAVAVPLALTPANVNFTNLATGSLFGTANTNYVRTAGNVNMLYGGNANFNANIRFGGPANDKDYILANGLTGNAAAVLSGVYSQSDVNMNKVLRFGGPANDKDFMLNTPLGGNTAVTKLQSLPN